MKFLAFSFFEYQLLTEVLPTKVPRPLDGDLGADKHNYISKLINKKIIKKTQEFT